MEYIVIPILQIYVIILYLLEVVLAVARRNFKWVHIEILWCSALRTNIFLLFEDGISVIKIRTRNISS